MPVLDLLNIDYFIDAKKIKEVSSSSMLVGSNFDPKGLFSEEIFGLNFSIDRKKTYGYISLNTKLIHPFIFELLKKMEQKIVKLIDGEKLYYDTVNKVFVDEKINENIREVSGYDGAVYVLRQGYNFRGGPSLRDEIKNRFEEVFKKNLIFIDKILVIPPDYRPILFKEESKEILSVDELNILYLKLLNLAKKIKFAQSNDEEGIMSESSLVRRDMQYLLEDIYTYAKLRVSKKTGLLRNNLLGKRVDFSARAVAASGYTKIPVGYIGVPFYIISNIAQPFLIHYIKNIPEKSHEYNRLQEILSKNKFSTTLTVLNIREFLRDLALQKVNLSKEDRDFLVELFQKIIGEKYILVKRDPSLHKGSWQSFKPIVTDTLHISFNIAQTSLFNLDFDGDQLALYMPLSLEAQEEAKDLWIPSGSTNIYQMSLDIKLDLLLTAYVITNDKEVIEKDGIIEYELKYLKENLDIGLMPGKSVYQKVKVTLYNGEKKITTLGRALFNSIFPVTFLKKYSFFIDETINKKVMNRILLELYQQFDANILGDILTEMTKFLGKYSTVYTKALTMSELLKAEEYFKNLKERYNTAQEIEKKQQIINTAEDRLKGDISSKMPVLDSYMSSGARANANQIRQILVSKGIVEDYKNMPFNIGNSFLDGLSPEEFFLSSYGARRGIMDRSRSTSTTGYLYRKIIYALASVIFDKELGDCGSKRTLTLKVTKKNQDLLLRRFILENNQRVLLDTSNISKYIDRNIDLRTPIFCKSLKICKTCYGDLTHLQKTPYIGILAAQTIGERGTQEIMKTFHLGGATKIQITDVLDEVVSNTIGLSRSVLEKYFVQKNTLVDVVSGYIIEIILNQSYYPEIGINSFTVNHERSAIMHFNNLVLSPFISEIKIRDTNGNILDEFEFILNEKVFLPLDGYDTVKDYRNEIGEKIIYLKGKTENIEPFLAVEMSTTNFNYVMKNVLQLLEKTDKIKYPEVLFNKLSEIYCDKFNIAYNHIELLVSQLFRNRKTPEYPARLIEPYDGVMYGLKSVPYLESFLSGLFFENISKSLSYAFVKDSTIHSPLEALMLDTF